MDPSQPQAQAAVAPGLHLPEIVYTAQVITVSTRASGGIYDDTAGPAGAKMLAALGLKVLPVVVVADGAPVGEALAQAVADRISVVITCGGTGLGPTDQTPEQTLAVVDRIAPGIAEYLRAKVWHRVPAAALSRGVAGIANSTLIINLPGSKKAVLESIEILAPILSHALDQIAGGDHERKE